MASTRLRDNVDSASFEKCRQRPKKRSPSINSCLYIQI